MESYRRKAKDAYGNKYESRVAPFRGLICLQMRRNPKLSVDDAAREMIGILKGTGKWNNHLQAAVFSAACDIKDGIESERN